MSELKTEAQAYYDLCAREHLAREMLQKVSNKRHDMEQVLYRKAAIGTTVVEVTASDGKPCGLSIEVPKDLGGVGHIKTVALAK